MASNAAWTLFFHDVDEAQKEEGGEEKVEHPIFADAGAAGEELEESIAGEAEAETVGDGPGERDCRDGEEGRDADPGLVPLDFAEAGEHESADKNERRVRWRRMGWLRLMVR